MYNLSRLEATRRRFNLLLPTTQRGLGRNGISEDKEIAPLSDRDLYRLAFIGPVGRQDIRRHFPHQ
ncbi:MAG TPA: hypothetical protein VNL71_14975 [Chloroflexota bacterium]|nr:hypothetical protein [Chloroflexota bacterium]